MRTVGEIIDEYDFNMRQLVKHAGILGLLDVLIIQLKENGHLDDAEDQ